MHEGHRQRMLRRLETSEESLQEHEILEILLFNAVPRKNTNPVAHELLTAFGSLEGVLRARADQLQTVNGVGAETAAYLRIIGIMNGRTKISKQTFPEGLSVATVEAYLQEHYFGQATETLEVYFLDSHGKVQYCSRFTDFSDKQASVKIDRINKLFAAHEPRGVLLAHNHPTASCLPSASDDGFTMQMMTYCMLNRVRLYDHVIIGTDGAYSYYRQRRLEEFAARCNENLTPPKP